MHSCWGAGHRGVREGRGSAPLAIPACATLAALVVLLGAGCGARSVEEAAAAGPSPGMRPDGVEVGWTGADCSAAREDEDGDGLDDGCELALARAFAPELVLEAGACSWDEAAEPRRPHGGYLFAARPAGEGDVLVAYLPAYQQDCGWSGPKCALLGRACEGHTGDSELIGIRVSAGDSATWTTQAIFLSAHCFGDRSCRWYAGAELARFEWVDGRTRGAPVVWVARGTNANYASRSACDRGHMFLDTCDRNAAAARFPVVSSAQNVGSAARPFLGRALSGCVRLADLPWPGDGPGTDPRGGPEECFWSEEPFRGWIRPVGGAPPTPYAVYLRSLMGF